jgi:hypothetical protein
MKSPNAAADLIDLIEGGVYVDEEQGYTDCPEGCIVEPDGICSHGYESAALTAGVI